MDKDSLKIIISGDVVINQDYPISRVDSALIDFFKEADISIINLEAPVTTSKEKIHKTGPHLRSNEKSTLMFLHTLGVNVATLANNHIRDFGAKGVTDTLDFCDINGIHVVGAGKDSSRAQDILCLKTAIGTIGVINVAENEWASATVDSPGANGMDLIANSKQIMQAKNKYDFVFVIVHGGHEYYNLPSPRMKKQYRFYVDCGADIVIGHHPHCISGWEQYKESYIYYSLGNFLFTKHNKNEDWYKGLLLELEIKKGLIKPHLRAVQQSQTDFQLSFMSNQNAEMLFNRVSVYNDIIANDKLLLENWTKYIEKKYDSIMSLWSPLAFIENRYIRGVLRKLGVNFKNKRAYSYLLNLIKCEAHADLSKETLTRYLKQ